MLEGAHQLRYAEGMAARNARSQRTAARPPSNNGRTLRVGDVLAGKYRVERILGEGGMGVVVAAHHELLDQRVAVKLLYQDIADREAQSRLLLEARAAAKIQSDHVARVVDVDTGADGLPFIVMELLEGADLCAIADARGALPRWLVVDYVLQALEGLAHAHTRGIVHRDLKPSNLFLANRPDGTQIIKILDFGISKTPDPDPAAGTGRHRALTGGGTVLGSPPYMSPEQVRSPKTVDHRTDIWALGVVMYELLTNTMPFGGEEMQETFAHILEHEPIPIRSLVHGVPEGLEQVVMRCLAKKREQRFADVGELARALAPFGSGTWIQSADRVAYTLARGAPEEPNSGLRLRGGGEALVPTSPGKRRDSVQPELHGTASTVAFTGDRRRRWMLAAIVMPAVLGVVIGGAALLRARALREEAREPAAVSGATAAPVEAPPTAENVPAGPATGIVTGPVHVAGPESEAPPSSPVQGGVALPPPRLVAASPAPPPDPAKRAAAASPTAKPTATGAAAKKPGPSATGTSRPSLPPGLPLTRE